MYKRQNITLEEDSETLDEVVVVGYGSSVKKDLTTAVTSVKSKDFLAGAVNDAMQMIDGKVAGVSVNSAAAADPNSSSSIQVRGASSLKAGNSPLVVIDGMPGGDLRNIAQADIESITVLKEMCIRDRESEVGLIPESLEANVDSLLRTWHGQYFSKREDFCHDDDENVYFPDSVYIDRLSRLPSVIALPYNNIVRDCIDLYAERKRNLVRYMLGMADFYFPIIEQVLDEHDLPIELKYLAVVESALNPVALSRVDVYKRQM